MEISRVWAMPNSKTFIIKPIKDLIDRHLFWEVTVDPFAFNNRIAKFRNDIDTDTTAEYHMDALTFLKTFSDASIDFILKKVE